MKREYSVKVTTKKERFFMYLFASTTRLDEQLNIINTMYLNKLDRLADELLDILNNFHKKTL